MSVVREMPRAKEVVKMSLAEMREHLARLRSGARMKPGDQARMASRMKAILVQLAKVGKRGGAFGKVSLSDEAREVYERSQWA